MGIDKCSCTKLAALAGGILIATSASVAQNTKAVESFTLDNSLVKNVDGKRLRQIARDITDVAGRTRTKQLTPDDKALVLGSDGLCVRRSKRRPTRPRAAQAAARARPCVATCRPRPLFALCQF